MGANRKIGRGGIGCDCPVNKLKDTRDKHKILDGEPDYTVDKRFQDIKCQYPGYKNSHIRKIAWGMTFGHYAKIMDALQHHFLRNRGKTKCSK